MVKFHKDLKSEPYQIVVKSIQVDQEGSGTPDSVVKDMADSCRELGFNLSLPVVCLTEEEDRYELLSGLPIYEAAVEANLDRMWVFVIAAQKPEVAEILDQFLTQSKLNTRIVSIADFLEFLNTKDKLELTKVSGIKDGYANLIASNRPFHSQAEMQKKLGPKRSLTWFKAYQELPAKS